VGSRWRPIGGTPPRGALVCLRPPLWRSRVSCNLTGAKRPCEGLRWLGLLKGPLRDLGTSAGSSLARLWERSGNILYVTILACADCVSGCQCWGHVADLRTDCKKRTLDTFTHEFARLHAKLACCYALPTLHLSCALTGVVEVQLLTDSVAVRYPKFSPKASRSELYTLIRACRLCLGGIHRTRQGRVALRRGDAGAVGRCLVAHMASETKAP